jgi:hypothetical protein
VGAPVILTHELMPSRSRRLRRMSNSSSSSASSGGMDFTGALTILFIGLKLGGVITWPWLWVLSPLWIPIALLLGIGIIALIGVALAVIFDK